MYGLEFRPQKFGDVLGLENVKDVLRGILRAEDYDQGYIFAGSHATGKTTLGRIFARAILCPHRTEDMSPCNMCPSCKDFLAERNPAYLEIDAASQGTKENIQAIKDSLRYEILSTRKIILFDEAHDISDAGKDALLLVLERPDPNVIIIFCTTELEKMHKSLRSRCMDFSIQDPSEKLVRSKLATICSAKSLQYEGEALDDIVRSVGRHYRDAENKLRQVTFLGPVTKDNVKRAVSMYVDETAGMLLTLSNDLGRALKFSDHLLSKMNVKSIYGLVVRLLVDSVKQSKGLAFSEGRYSQILSAIWRTYGAMVFEILDYMVSRNRLGDQQMFQSDLLVMHYRFRKGLFEAKQVEMKSPDVLQPSKEVTVRKVPSISELAKLPDGKKEDAIREFKENRRKQRADERVPERVSKVWGPEVKENVEQLIHRRPVSRDEMERVLKGTRNEEKI